MPRLRDPKPPLPDRRAPDRAVRIRAFRDELAQAERDRVLLLTEEQRLRLLRYHEGILRGLAPRPAPEPEKPPEPEEAAPGVPAVAGAKSALLSAVALLAVYQLWSPAPAVWRIACFAVASLALAWATHRLSLRGRGAVLASPMGLAALGCFVSELLLLARSLNVEAFPHALVPWAGFAFVLAYAYRLRLLLAAGILLASAYVAALLPMAGGSHWLAASQRPETFFPGGIGLLAISALVRHPERPEFPAVYRSLGLLSVLLPVLILANWGDTSFIRAPAEQVQAIYMAIGATVAGLAVVAGLWWGSFRLTGVGVGFLSVFLSAKLYERSAVLAGGLVALGALVLALHFGSVYRRKRG